MDIVGRLMGLVTLPMALFSVLSIFGAAVLLVLDEWQPVVVGLAGFAICLPLAIVLEQIVVSIDEAAIQSANRNDRRTARLIAVVSGGLPMAVILIWEFLTFRILLNGASGFSEVALWLWSYGVATGPWTIFALRVSRFRRTLCGIRAYAGHLAYWLLTALMLVFGAGPAIAAISMALPAILPFTVGLLLALADRDALTNVRV